MVKVNMGDYPRTIPGVAIDLGKAEQVVISHSESNPGQWHIAVKLYEPVVVKRFGGEVTILCSCRGFQNHRKCWHIMEFQSSEEEEQ